MQSFDAMRPTRDAYAEQGSSITVALVGREEPGDENLALRYLASALDRAGHEARIVPLGGPLTLVRAVADVLEIGPALVGVSLADADTSIDGLAFIRLLRRQGYKGHVTCGGALATIGRHELLAKHPGIDSIIRHDGETPITLLAQRVAQSRSFDDLPAVTTRSGDGLPAAVTDATAIRIQPRHPNPLPRILGLPVARMVASRGCPGRCSYCSPAAIQKQAVAEGLAAGHCLEELQSAGVGGTRRRAPESVADEVAQLYHESGARVFHMLDDNMLSGPTANVEAWLTALITALRARGVDKVAFSMQAEPVTLTPRVLDLLQELGVVRIAAGVEALTPEQLRALGRTGEPSANRELLRDLRSRGIVAVFNSLVVHPQASAEGISAELSALEAIEGIHYDAFAMAIYPGTLAHHRLDDKDCVSGGLLGLGYDIRDPVVSRFRALLIQLRLLAIRRYGINVFAHDVGLNIALARHFGLASYTAELESDSDAVLRDINAARLRAWRSALAIAQADLNLQQRTSAASALIASLRQDLQPFWDKLDEIQTRLETVCPGSTRRSNLLVASALAAGVVLLLGSTGCDSPPPDIVVGVGGTTSTTSHNVGGANSLGGAGGVGGSTYSLPDAGDCGSTQSSELRALVQDCARLCPDYGIVIDAEGKAIDIVMGDAGLQLPESVRTCYLEALAGHQFPCLAGDTIINQCVIVCLF
jgi:methylmalonyl-CoA mutase cobalamin-binding subunit